MSEAITAEDQITPRWLTARLLENGHLQRGKVSGVNKESFTTHFSHICRLGLTYSSDAAPALPLNMALQWYPERRALMELALLKCYHDRLVSLGVKDYGWDDCLLDYRFSVISHLFTPVFQRAGNRVPAAVWWHNLDRIFQAYEDLHCGELL